MPPKAKPKSKPQKTRKLSQKQRFLEAARKAEVDESGETFELAFKKILRKRLAQEDQS
jgi:hypothetical protein